MKRTKQILAILGIVILVALYVIAFVFALTDNPDSMHMFAMAIVATVVIPVFFYVYSLIFKWTRGRREYNQFVMDEVARQAADEADKETSSSEET